MTEIECCPACDYARFVVRASNPMGSHVESDCRYRCKRCNQQFDEPAVRKRRNDAIGLRGSQRVLWEADPDDYPREARNA